MLTLGELRALMEKLSHEPDDRAVEVDVKKEHSSERTLMVDARIVKNLFGECLLIMVDIGGLDL